MKEEDREVWKEGRGRSVARVVTYLLYIECCVKII